MKKNISIFILILIIALCMFGCGKNEFKSNTNTTTVTESETTIKSAEITSKKTSEINKNTDIGDGDILPDKYRLCYYQVPYKFSQLVDKDEFDNWYQQIFLVYPNETNQMIIKRFVQDFNISREAFNKTNYEDALSIMNSSGEVPVMNPQDFINQESWEVFNSDIIYTFDDDLINEYYKSNPYPFELEQDYVDAVLEGTYKTQTTEFFFPEIDSHSSPMLRGYEYPEEASVAPATENINDK